MIYHSLYLCWTCLWKYFVNVSYEMRWNNKIIVLYCIVHTLEMVGNILKNMLTHLSLACFLWDIDKQCRSRWKSPKKRPRNAVKNSVTHYKICGHSRKTPSWLTLNAPIATKVVCFSRLLKCLRSLYGKRCGPRSDCSSGSTLFACILNLSVMLGSYLQQTTSADDIFRCIFFFGALRVNAWTRTLLSGLCS